jgi:hypothetical protein
VAKKSAKKYRGQFLDASKRAMGAEPDLRSGVPSNGELLRAYGWYNYFYNSEDAQKFTVAWYKDQGEKGLAKSLAKVKSSELRTIGWNCRILTLGGNLPEMLKNRMDLRVEELAAIPVIEEEVDEKPKVPVISIQERLANKTSKLIGELEGELDTYTVDRKSNFSIKIWLEQNDVKPAIAEKIAAKFRPVYAELFDAVAGKDADLKEGYAHWKKPALKKYMEFVRTFIAESENRTETVKATRKPRKKKEKTPTQLVAKMRIKPDPTGPRLEDIIGASQIWVYNEKYRVLTVLNAMGPAGLSVRGSTVIGFDEKVSVSKKLRKPEETLDRLALGGKIVLRKLMDELTTKPKVVNGRCNADTVLIRVTR